MSQRLLFLVEGETEEAFVEEMLRPHLLSLGYTSAEPRLIGLKRNRQNRGGIVKWGNASRDIQRHLKQDPQLVVTTFVDYYGLPATEPHAWPGRSESASHSGPQKAVVVEQAVFDFVNQSLGGNLNPDRFIPFVMMHEFEALLFSDCEGFARGIYQPELASQFQAIRDAFDTPEDINDDKTTAPSKRIEEIVVEYRKPVYGNLAALKIGLATIRKECPHFDQWLSALEKIPCSSSP